MPLLFIVLGLVLVVGGTRGNGSQLLSQLADDFGGFLAFGAVVLILGCLGFIESLRPVTKGLLALVFVVFILKNGSAIKSNIVRAAQPDPNAGSAAQAQSATDSGSSALQSLQSLPALPSIGGALGSTTTTSTAADAASFA